MKDKTISYKTIIDENNYIVNRSILSINGELQHFRLKTGQKAVNFCPVFLIKGQFKNGEWVETATQKEIEEYYNKYMFLQ